MSIRTKIKSILRTHFPRFWDQCCMFRETQIFKEALNIDKSLIAKHGDKVLSGPFKGMVHTPRRQGGGIANKLIGSYEAELHPVINELLNKSYDHIINIGCAEGYYAVGMALFGKSPKVLAYDTAPLAQALCANMVKLNKAENKVDIGGTCDHSLLADLTKKHSLILIDCEGAEYELLDPEQVPGLKHSDVLVELHDFVRSDISQTIYDRFQSTHTIQTILSADRDPVDYPHIAYLSPDEQALAIKEKPFEIKWYYMTANATLNK